MNTYELFSILQQSGFKAVILIVCAALGALIAGYNWLYLYHSPRASTKHMGINSPSYIRRVIKISIFLSLLTAFMSVIILILGTY